VGVLSYTPGFCWVVQGTGGALVGAKGTGGTAWYCWVLQDIETLLPISTPPPSTPQHPVAPSHTRKYPTVPHSTPLLLHSTSSTTQYSVVPPQCLLVPLVPPNALKPPNTPQHPIVRSSTQQYPTITYSTLHYPSATPSSPSTQ